MTWNISIKKLFYTGASFYNGDLDPNCGLLTQERLDTNIETRRCLHFCIIEHASCWVTKLVVELKVGRRCSEREKFAFKELAYVSIVTICCVQLVNDLQPFFAFDRLGLVKYPFEDCISITLLSQLLKFSSQVHECSRCVNKRADEILKSFKRSSLGWSLKIAAALSGKNILTTLSAARSKNFLRYLFVLNSQTLKPYNG